LRVVRPEGATGDGETQLGAKVEATLASLGADDFVVVHVAMVDVAAHTGDGPRKAAAIERLDEQLIGPLLEGLRARGGEWRVLVVSDHATSSATRRHTADAVPFVVATARDDAKTTSQKRGYGERDAREQGIFLPDGHALLERMLRP
jgi:2,3-bisphosphoglycerate-independent phosphoglycerate mutase